ncbi:UDP-N-acetyl-alpha-D-muramoyl-L-alanyl-L-glutamate epimerase [Dokdonella sp.]|uniref:UDP-N-acetyl-alpha-D-muramoyl-L-alanyl-L- glutamate epimerase n=1 Tax=Dokdonella sp. TaxID=2291710 RepID=UPI001B0815A6|nr:UDP-N-acetyl-alpha-D-muramoyl-L-alanyl-L-glutamate epimerase [Dokdonella sp.]MBO9663781.1 endonuclease domain-containing protein [Dokdonella sp.]
MALADPRAAGAFRFVRRDYADGVAALAYAFDDGPELVERIVFPDAPALPPERAAAFEAALDLLHWIAGVSYYKAGVPGRIEVESATLDASSAAFLDALYLHGLGEFAYHNKLDLRGRIRFPGRRESEERTASLRLPPRTLVPIGGGKDSLVSVEILKAAGADATAVWVGNSPLIAACAERTGLPTLNIRRELSPLLFDYNKAGAYNGHIPVTAINSAILVAAAVLYGYDAIAFSNERSASSATLEYDGQPVNHQWSKGWEFERSFGERVHACVAADLHYYSLLRPLSELAVAERFARNTRYDESFSSCNRNFRILGAKPAERWCGQCPKCHFVFLALAPFMPKPRLLAIFGRNLLDDAALAPGFDALIEYRDHKPFECVGEGVESRAAFAALAARAEWREDALVARFVDEVAPQLDAHGLALDDLLAPSGEHRIPVPLQPFVFDAHR